MLLTNSSIASMESDEKPALKHLLEAMKVDNALLTKQILTDNPLLVQAKINDILLLRRLYSRDTITPLHIAQKKCAKVLIEHGADVKACSAQGKTPLDFLLLDKKMYDESLVQYLIDCKAGVNNTKDICDRSTLHYLIEENVDWALSRIPFLLRNGADIEIRDNRGRTPVDVAIIKNSKCLRDFEKYGVMFVYHQSKANPQTLLSNNAQVFKQHVYAHIPEQPDESTVIERQLADLFRFIEKWNRKNRYYYQCSDNPSHQGIIITKYGYCFKKPTWDDMYAWFGQESIETVKQHFDARCKKAYKALKKNPKQFLKMLRVYPYVLTYDSSRTREIFEYMTKNMRGNKYKGCISSTLEYLLLLDLDEGINLTYGGFKQTLLHRAMMNNNPLFVRLLMEYGIDFTCVESIYNKTAIQNAEENTDDRQDCIENFYNALAQRLPQIKETDAFCKKVKAFLSQNCDINRKNRSGRTLLFEIAKSSRYWSTFLLKRGALVNIKDQKNQSPLMNAVRYCYHDEHSVNVLLQYGAIVTAKMIQSVKNEEIQAMLKSAYEEQICCVCYEHPQDLGELPCINKHQGNFVCGQCCSHLKECPFRCGDLSSFVAM